MKKHISCLCGLVILLLLVTGVSNAIAAEFHVTDAAGLTTALTTAGGNDEDDDIYLAAGTYGGNFFFRTDDGKFLTIQGEVGTNTEGVILDAGGTGSVLELSGSSVGGHVTVEGLTIQNAGYSGLRIGCGNGSVEVSLKRVLVQNNLTTYMGGAIYARTLENGTITLQIWDSIIRGNQALGNGRGGGMKGHSYAGNSTLEILVGNCLIYNNQAKATGGGIDVSASEVGENNITRLTVINSTMTGNISNMYDDPGIEQEGGGIRAYAYHGTGATVQLDLYNSILCGNQALGGDTSQDLHVEQRDPGMITVNAHYSDIGNVTVASGQYNPVHVINADPLFVDPGNEDYHLWYESPCIDVGNNSAPGLPAFDFEGEGRVLDGDEDGTGTVDMGADEYVPVIYTHVTLLSPNGKEATPSGSTRTIRWGAPSEATQFKLSYSRDNGKSWRQIRSEPFVQGTRYNWNVPTPMKNEKNCFIRVCGFNEFNEKIGCDRSENPFTVEVVRLISPNGEESWDSGSEQTIRWTTHETKAPVAKVNLYLSMNGGKSWKLMGSETGDPESHAWTLPELGKTKGRCKVKVQLRDADRRIVGEDVSEGVFTINPVP